jgi:hypothetical protein
MITSGVYQLIRYRGSDLPAEAGSHESQNTSHESQNTSHESQTLSTSHKHYRVASAFRRKSEARRASRHSAVTGH